MKRHTHRPLAEYRRDIHNIMSKFTINDGISIDPVSGLMRMPEGFARLYHHSPTNTVGLLFSKEADNLKGITDAEGNTQISDQQLKRCYHVAAYRCDSQDASVPLGKLHNHQAMVNDLRKDLDKFRHKYKDRTHKHFTLYMAKLQGQTAGLQKAGINYKSDTYIFTNKQLAYVVDKKDKGYEVKLIVPTKRRDGSFIPPVLVDSSWRGRFNKESAKLATGLSFAEAKAFVEDHWVGMSQKLWEEQDILSTHTRLFRARAQAKATSNKIASNLPRLSFTVTGVGSAFYLINPELTWLGAVAGAGVHTAADLFLDEVYAESTSRMKETKKKPNITDYDIGENATNYFRVPYKEEIGRLCARLDLNKIHGADLNFLQFEDMNLYSNKMQLVPHDEVDSAEEAIAHMHHRGLSSVCQILSDNTVVHQFQNGVARLTHYDDETKTYQVFAAYHSDRTQPHITPLASKFQEYMDGHIIGYSYQKDALHFGKSASETEYYQSTNEIIGELTQWIRYPATDNQPEHRYVNENIMHQLLGKPEQSVPYIANTLNLKESYVTLLP